MNALLLSVPAVRVKVHLLAWLTIVVDHTQWQDLNLLMVSLIWQKRGLFSARFLSYGAYLICFLALSPRQCTRSMVLLFLQLLASADDLGELGQLQWR